MGQNTVVLQAVENGDLMLEREVRVKGIVLRVIPKKTIDETEAGEQIIMRENTSELKWNNERILSSWELLENGNHFVKF